jgi:6-methylsalicylate decarboxylase
MSEPIWKIDTHHHFFPPYFLEKLNALGIKEEAGTPIPEWSPEISLGVMDANFIKRSILSVSAPGVYFPGQTINQTTQLARECNEYGAKLKQKYPERFGFFAVLPMPFTAQSCQESIYALEVLDADGIVLLGSTDGYFLGDPVFEELMYELNKRSAVVFVHPNINDSSKGLNLVAPEFVVEFLCDTTRAALNLILTGTKEKYPQIQWILAHAGGFIPYIAWRASLLDFHSKFSEKAPKGVINYLKEFYYDTALSPSPYSMKTLVELVGFDKILFGSDFPYAPSVATESQILILDQSMYISKEEKESLYFVNSLKLFPSLINSSWE